MQFHPRTLIGRLLIAAVAIIGALGASAFAQSDEETEKALEKYRQMLSDPFSNPGYLAVDRGEELWSRKRGASNVSLESCDLGEGPGKLEGAFARLPRFFADAGKGMDLEQRLLRCMETVQ